MNTQSPVARPRRQCVPWHGLAPASASAPGTGAAAHIPARCGLLPPLGWGLLALQFPPDQHLEPPHLFRHLRSLFCDFLEWLYRKSWVVMHKLWVEFCPAGIRFRLGGFCGFSCNKDGVFSGGVSSVALTALPSRPCAIEP